LLSYSKSEILNEDAMGSPVGGDAEHPRTAPAPASEEGPITRLRQMAEKGLRAGLLRAVAGKMISGPEERDAYVHEVRHEIQGWNGTGALRLVHEIARQQTDLGIKGDMAEIGVHHGQLFIFLMMLMRSNEQAIAIDLFEDQHLNVDASGKGDREVFLTNVEKFCPQAGKQLSVIAGDSTKIRPGEILAAGRAPVRLFSVDGGHTRDIVINDLFLAADALHDAGVIILDDVFNAYFPGVSEGLAAYVRNDVDRDRFRSYKNHDRRLSPFAIGCNKVLLAFEPYRTKYAQALLQSPLAKHINGATIGWGVEGIPVFEM
jgi:hypothetical protein